MSSEFAAAIYALVGAVFLMWAKDAYLFHVAEPRREYFNIRGKIAFAIYYYADVIHTPLVMGSPSFDIQIDRYTESQLKLRELASELYRIDHVLYDSIRRGIPSRGIISNATHSLIGLSNSLIVPEATAERYRDNREYEKELIEALSLNSTH